MMQEKVLTNIILKSGEKDASRGVEYVEGAFGKYGIRRYAVLVDKTSIPEDVPVPAGRELTGFYSFDIEKVGTIFAGGRVELITLNGPMPDCDGWLLMSTARSAVVALNHALVRTGKEGQVIVRLYGGQVSVINAYMDVFSGETQTVVQIHHYFERKYRINFPLDLRYTICSCDGTVRAAGQRILPPGGLTVLDTRQLNLGDFAGYLRLELEVENLQMRVQPFIHFWADYISAAGLSRNHQSGWDQWAADTVFARGYYPVESDLELTLAFYNENDCETHPVVLLHFTKDGKEMAVERPADPVPARQMSYQNISQLFADISLEGVASAFYLVKCDTPLHRPNYYIAPKGTRQYINTSHQTGSDARHWAVPTDLYPAHHLKKLNEFNVDPWVIAFPILEERFEIDTYLGLLSSTIAILRDFTVTIRDERGRVVLVRDERLDETSPEFLNLNEYVRRHGVKLDRGLLGLAPRKGSLEVPRRAISLLGFKHKEYRYLSTAPAAGFEDPNLPFYVDSPVPLQQQYEYSPVLVTDRFGPGMVSDEFDTLYIITNCSLDRHYARECTYRLEVYDSAGRMHCVYRTIPPQSHDTFWLSEILKDAKIGSGSPYFTVWQKCHDTLLISYHFLHRKRDHAMSCDDTFAGTLLLEPQVWDVTGNGEFARPVLRGKNVITARR
jgi:hypothetical protein